MVKYRIKLTQEEVSELSSIIKKGSHTTQAYRAAYVLLNCDEGEYSRGKLTSEQIASVLRIGMRTIDRIKEKCVEGGIERALERADSLTPNLVIGKLEEAYWKQEPINIRKCNQIHQIGL